MNAQNLTAQDIENAKARIRDRRIKGIMAVGYLLESLGVDEKRIDSALEVLFPLELGDFEEAEKKKKIRESLVLP